MNIIDYRTVNFNEANLNALLASLSGLTGVFYKIFGYHFFTNVSPAGGVDAQLILNGGGYRKHILPNAHFNFCYKSSFTLSC